MKDPLAKNGTLAAQRDWEERNACFMYFGDMYSERPLINQNGLYFAFSFDESYVKDYNREIARLIESQGLPSWAPGNRIPSKARIRQLLVSSVSFESYRPARKRVEHIIESLRVERLEEHGCGPEAVALDEVNEVLLIGGNTPQGYRVDLVDLTFRCYMYTYEAGRIKPIL